MTDNIKLPPMPKPHTPPVFATAANTQSVKAGYELGGYEKTPPLFDEHQLEAYAREAVRLNATVPEISTEHGPWIESNIHEGETYCKRCLVRSVFAGHKKCEPHIVSAPAAPQPAQPAQQPLTDEKDALDLLRQALVALEGFVNITNDSQGVAGYHLSGDTAEWDEFDEVDAASNTIEAIRNHLGVKND